MIFRSTIILAACLFLSCDADDSPRLITRMRYVPPQDTPAAAMSDAERFGLEPQPTAAPAPPSYTYVLPRGWSAGPSRPMRDLNFAIAGAADVECYVMTLGGDGGGLEANINRWRAQMGGSALRADAESIPMLGATGTVVELRGTYTGMDGQAHADYALLGVICALPGRTVFIKMVGPAAQVSSQKDSLLQFSRSLKSKP